MEKTLLNGKLTITIKNLANIKRGVRLDYDEIKPFQEGFAVVKKDDIKDDIKDDMVIPMCGYINELGIEVIPCQYKTASDFKDGMAIVTKQDGKCTIIDKTGKELLHGNYFKIFGYEDDVIRVCRKVKGRYELATINFKEEPICTYKVLLKYKNPCDCFMEPIKDGTMIIRYDFRNCSLFSVETGKEIISHKWDIERTESGLFIVKNKANFSGLIDSKGKVKVPFRYNYLKGEVPSVLAEDGSLIPNGEVQTAYYLAKNLFDSGFINKNGETIIDFTFHDASRFSNGLAAVANEKGKWGYVNKKGKLVIPFQFTEADDFSLAGTAMVQFPDHQYGLINQQGNVVSSLYMRKRDFDHGYAIVEKYGKMGLINSSGKEILPCDYFLPCDYYYYGYDYSMRVSPYGVTACRDKEWFASDFKGNVTKLPPEVTNPTFLNEHLLNFYYLDSQNIYDLNTKKVLLVPKPEVVSFGDPTELMQDQTISILSIGYQLTVSRGETKRTYVFATKEKRQEFLARLVAGQTSMETPLPKVRIKRK